MCFACEYTVYRKLTKKFQYISFESLIAKLLPGPAAEAYGRNLHGSDGVSITIHSFLCSVVVVVL